MQHTKVEVNGTFKSTGVFPLLSSAEERVTKYRSSSAGDETTDHFICRINKNFSLNKIQFNLIQTRKNALSYLKGLTGRIFAKGERPHQLAMVRLTNQTP